MRHNRRHPIGSNPKIGAWIALPHGKSTATLGGGGGGRGGGGGSGSSGGGSHVEKQRELHAAAHEQ
jgi:hypothetical protein